MSLSKSLINFIIKVLIKVRKTWDNYIEANKYFVMLHYTHTTNVSYSNMSELGQNKAKSALEYNSYR